MSFPIKELQAFAPKHPPPAELHFTYLFNTHVLLSNTKLIIPRLQVQTGPFFSTTLQVAVGHDTAVRWPPQPGH